MKRRRYGARDRARGRAPAAARGVALIERETDLVPRPQPLAELSDEEAAEWVALCNVVPADYFPGATHMIVASYCRHVVIARHLAELIERCAKRRPFPTREYLGLIREQRGQTQAIYACLRSMRLTHLATYNKDRAPIAADVPKPWET